MTRPGDRLRSFAARWCGTDTLTRVIDPLVADLQAEYHDARASGFVWRSRWIRIAGLATFIRVVATCAVRSATREMTIWPDEDRRALGRTVGVAAIAITACMTLLLAWPIVRHLQRFPGDWSILYVVPQAIPFAVAFGLSFGAWLGPGRGLTSSRLRLAVVALALLGSAASFATMSWIAPTANQTFRVAVFRSQPAANEGARSTALSRGMAELTRPELKARIETLSREGANAPSALRELATLELRYHTGAALPAASLAIVLLAIAAIPRRQLPSWILGAAALAGCAGYFVLLVKGAGWGQDGSLSPFLAAWLPNLVFGGLAGILMLRSANPARRRA